MTAAAILHTITCIIGRRVVLNVLQPHITPLKGANFLLKQYFYVLHLLDGYSDLQGLQIFPL